MLCWKTPDGCRGTGTISTVSEHAYDQYMRLMFKEQEPELLITLPQHAAAGPDQQQQPQGQPDGEQAEAAAAGGADSKQGQQGTASDKAATPVAPVGASGDHTAPGVTAAAGATAPVGPAGRAEGGSNSDSKPSILQLTICVTFSKLFGNGSNSSSIDTSVLVQQQCMVANPLLRRSRGWFPCIDSPLFLYTPGALHLVPYTFDLNVTVPPSCMAVCSGVLSQQTCSVATHPSAAAHNAAVALAAEAGAGGSADAGAEATVVVARTFEYSVTTPVVPAQLSIAVGPFAAVPFADLLAAAGCPGISLPAGSPAVTVFALKSRGTGSSGSRSSSAAGRHQHGSNGTSGAAGDGTAAAAATAAAVGPDTGAVGAAGIAALSAAEVRQLADTLKPLAVLLRSYAKVLACSFPWSHLQVAIVPEGTMLQEWQVRMDGMCLCEEVRESVRKQGVCGATTAGAVGAFTLVCMLCDACSGTGAGNQAG